jgi:hypothetical protein
MPPLELNNSEMSMLLYLERPDQRLRPAISAGGRPRARGEGTRRRDWRGFGAPGGAHGSEALFDPPQLGEASIGALIVSLAVARRREAVLARSSSTSFRVKTSLMMRRSLSASKRAKRHIPQLPRWAECERALRLS